MASFDVKAGVANRVAAKAARSTFKLQGASESTDSSWMRFAGPKHPTASYQPKLSVTYNTPPTAPNGSMMWAPNQATGCKTTAPGPTLNPTVGVAVSLYARLSDPDGDAVTGQMHIINSVGTAIHYVAFTSRASGSLVSMTVPSTLGNGQYRFNSAVSDGRVNSGYGPVCYFTVDKTAPPTPVVTSDVWKDGVLAPQDATQGTFTMTAPGASHISYRWDSVLPAASSLTDSTGTAQVPERTTRSLDFWHSVASDAAGNVGGTSYFYVKRAQPGKLAEYRFNGSLTSEGMSPPCGDDGAQPVCDVANKQLDSESNLTDPDASKAYRFDLPADEAAVAPGEGRWAQSVPDTSNHALVTDGGPAGVRLAQRPLVSERSFTIGGWVFMSDSTQSRTFVSQERDVNPTPGAPAVLAYDLGYDQASDRFVGRVMDATGVVRGQALDSLPRTVPGSTVTPVSHDGSWVYVVMVFDAGAKTLRVDAAHAGVINPPGSENFLYSPGQPVAVSGTVASGVGAFTLGSGSSAVGERAGWSGGIDNVALWQGVPATDTLKLNAGYQR